ncbi:uncharacterized protein LOC141599151 [Silene latifolia]|uniref:uncharacterized protein LOC141599151 n=1 Tax=Silene latifolia TaxID=37657 RepID=UPI003D7825E1
MSTLVTLRGASAAAVVVGVSTRFAKVRSVRPLLYVNSRRGNSLRMSSGTTSGEEVTAKEEVVVQYVVLRRDLIDTWPMGSVVTQGCHASVAAIWENKDDPVTLSYCSPPNIDSMHKVTLEVKGETQLVKLSEKLKAGGITHKMWIEQPENYPTCLATKPYPKSLVSPFLKNLKLCK